MADPHLVRTPNGEPWPEDLGFDGVVGRNDVTGFGILRTPEDEKSYIEVTYLNSNCERAIDPEAVAWVDATEDEWRAAAISTFNARKAKREAR